MIDLGKLKNALDTGAKVTAEKAPEIPIDNDRNLRTEKLGKAISDELRRIYAEKCRRSLAFFVRESWHVLEPDVPLDWNWHHQVVCDHVQWLLENWLNPNNRKYPARLQKLIVNVPPGSLKSRIVSVCAPAWFWLRCPSWRVLAISGNPAVALRDADLSRSLVLSQWYQQSLQPDWSLRDDQSAVGNYGTTKGGLRSSRGITAEIIGLRADMILFDDPNDPITSLDASTRNGINAKVKRGLGRVNDRRKSTAVLIQQRCHADDASGHLLKLDPYDRQTGRGFLCLKIPTRFQEAKRLDTPIFSDPRSDNELLHTIRDDEQTDQSERIRLGSYQYSAQHGQDPNPEGGILFKRDQFRWFRLPGDPVVYTRSEGCLTPEQAPTKIIDLSDFDSVLCSVDCAFKDAAGSDRVAVQAWGIKGADRYLLKTYTKVRSFTETIKAILQTRAEFPTMTKTLVEDKANGSAVIDTLKSSVSGMISINPEGGKISRAYAATPAVESGNVYLRETGVGVQEFLTEVCIFPNGPHDDDVDAFTQMVAHTANSPDLSRLLNAYGSR